MVWAVFFDYSLFSDHRTRLRENDYKRRGVLSFCSGNEYRTVNREPTLAAVFFFFNRIQTAARRAPTHDGGLAFVTATVLLSVPYVVAVVARAVLTRISDHGHVIFRRMSQGGAVTPKYDILCVTAAVHSSVAQQQP